MFWKRDHLAGPTSSKNNNNNNNNNNSNTPTIKAVTLADIIMEKIAEKEQLQGQTKEEIGNDMAINQSIHLSVYLSSISRILS